MHNFRNRRILENITAIVNTANDSYDCLIYIVVNDHNGNYAAVNTIEKTIVCYGTLDNVYSEIQRTVL